MPKYTVQNGTVVVLKNQQKPELGRDTLKVGAEIELDVAAAQKMDPTGFYLCPSNKFRKGKTYTPKAAVSDDEDDLDEDEELEKATRPAAKPTPKA